MCSRIGVEAILSMQAALGPTRQGSSTALYCRLAAAVGVVKRRSSWEAALTQLTLLELFSQLSDHRRAEGKLYPLPQILVFCLLAMLAGATSYRKMHEFIMVHFRRLSRLFPSKMRGPANSPPLAAGTEPSGEAKPPLTNNFIWQEEKSSIRIRLL